MTYAELVELIQQYCENDETSFVDNIPNFVKLAEERIYRYVKVPGLRTTTTSTLSIGNNELPLPNDFISADSFEIMINNFWIHMMPKDFDFLSQAFPDSTLTAPPQYYAQFDNAEIRMAPTPDAGYAYRLTYTRKPQSIVDAGQTWAGDNAEMALLYGALVEAYTYMKGEPDIMALYEQRFLEAVGEARKIGNGKTRTDEWRNAPPMAT